MIIQAGKQFDAAKLKYDAGQIAATIFGSIQDGTQIGTQLATWPDADLITLGLTQEEINALKGFFTGDLPGIANLLKQSTWIKQLLGTGI